MLLPDIRAASGDFFRFSAEQHPITSRHTVALLDLETADFIRLHNSPDLNTVDHTVWSVHQD